MDAGNIGLMDTAERIDDLFDLTLGMDFHTEPAGIRELTDQLRQAEAFDVGDAESEDLAEYIDALKDLEKAAKEARKEIFEDELTTRVRVNEEVGPLVKRKGGRRYVVDDTEAFDAINLNGGNPFAAMSMKASTTAEMLEALGLDVDQFIEKREYEYFTRV